MTDEHTWPEIILAAKENRHELILVGPGISNRISKSGIDPALFTLQSLNYLDIHQTNLEVIPEDIGNLTNLTSLVLHSNNVKKLAKSVKNLKKLKILDCSRNKLESLPQEIENLPQLTILNLGLNLLDNLPSQKLNSKLTLLDLSNNKFESFPDIVHPELIHLAEIKLNGNLIKEIPNNIHILTSLKLLDLSSNKITIVPGELADCPKLKDLNLKGNILSDKRFLKLVDQCRTKQVLDYIRQHFPKSETNQGINNNKSKKGKRSHKSSIDENILKTIGKLTHELQVMKVKDETLKIEITDKVKAVRPHIIACILKNVTLSEESFKKFIQLQTKFHESVCEKRTAATIATHDLNLLIPGNLVYTAKPPGDIEIQPLMRNKVYTGAELFYKLQSEAEALRKEKKRNTYSGIHKYLYLIEGKSLFPCLLDSSNRVISFPPITNSEISKISSNTKNILIEITSATSQQICREVMDKFLKELVILGLGCVSETSDSDDFHKLIVEQVKVVDAEGNLKQVYPSRTDLNFEDNTIFINRE